MPTTHIAGTIQLTGIFEFIWFVFEIEDYVRLVNFLRFLNSLFGEIFEYC